MIIFDNFFDDPDPVRQLALSCQFNKDGGHTSVPGRRSDHLKYIDFNIYNSFQNRLLDIIFGQGEYSVTLDVRFALVPEHYEEGWVHTDSSNEHDPVTMAGLVYLTPNAPLNAGTSIYKQKDNITPIDYGSLKHDFYADKLQVSMDEYRTARDTHNSWFDKTVDVSNIYNRMIVYNSRQLHRENKFFGTTKENTRLTLLFFGNIQKL